MTSRDVAMVLVDAVCERVSKHERLGRIHESECWDLFETSLEFIAGERLHIKTHESNAVRVADQCCFMEGRKKWNIHIHHRVEVERTEDARRNTTKQSQEDREEAVFVQVFQ